ncbi:hypothetical protein EVAR_39570_1 [Eumeta japonica]|uniref:Uncharacterized protein n=1 Tax=Eumeta variegata TaxID=151549 RepID=A0A4C1XNS8_EUMVA|nr:hypothetical protein EVAR_39570_1 [Eumeta japonica]
MVRKDLLKLMDNKQLAQIIACLEKADSKGIPSSSSASVTGRARNRSTRRAYNTCNKLIYPDNFKQSLIGVNVMGRVTDTPLLYISANNVGKITYVEIHALAKFISNFMRHAISIDR